MWTWNKILKKWQIGLKKTSLSHTKPHLTTPSRWMSVEIKHLSKKKNGVKSRLYKHLVNGWMTIETLIFIFLNILFKICEKIIKLYLGLLV